MTEKDYHDFAPELARHRAKPKGRIAELTETGYTECCNTFAGIFREHNPTFNAHTFLEITHQVSDGEHADIPPPKPVKNLREALMLVEERRKAQVVELAGIVIKVFPPKPSQRKYKAILEDVA